jgi:hypothetical protein
MARTVRLGGTIAEMVAAEGEEGSIVVAWGIEGTSMDGWVSLAPSEERVRSHVRFAQSRVAGKPGHLVVYGPGELVHAFIYPPKNPPAWGLTTSVNWD